MDEWALTLYVSISTVAVYIGLLLTRRSSVVFGLLASLILIYVHQHSLGVFVEGDLMTHVFPGFVLVLTGKRTMLSASGLPTFDWRLPCAVLAPFFLFFIVSQMIAQMFEPGHRGFKQTGHDMINVCCASLSLSFGSESLAARLGAKRDTIDALRVARASHDPLAIAAVGLILLGHQHDKAEVAVAFHTTQGYLMLLLAVVSVGCSAAHLSGAAPTGRACQFARALHAYTYLLAGSWLAQMGVFLYIFRNHRGLHHLLAELDSFGDPKPWEEVSIYLSVQTWICACVVSGWHVREHRRAGSSAAVQPAKEAIAGEKRGGARGGEEAGALLGIEGERANGCNAC